MLVFESIDDFKRNVDPRTGLDIGYDSSYFWPKSYDELSAEQKEKAYQIWSEITEPDHAFLANDDALLEPPDAELRKLFGSEYYDKIFPMIQNSDYQKVYYSDLDGAGSVDISQSVKISDDTAFLQWLGIPLEMHEKLYYDIDIYDIEFEPYEWINDDEEFSEKEEEIIKRAKKKWAEHLDFIRNNLIKQWEYLKSEEFFDEEVNSHEWEFDKNLNIIE